MSTPEKQSTNAAAKTPGWGTALFGIFSTQKKAPPGQYGSSTNPTSSVARTPRANQMELDLNAPLEQEGPSFGQSKVATSAIDLLDTQGDSGWPMEYPDEPHTLSVAQSPWTSPSARTALTMNGSGPQFSVGNLKPPPASRLSMSNRQTGVPSTARRRRYKASTLLVPKRRTTGPMNPTNAVNALRQSQSIFQPTSRQIEARNNYTGFRAGRGKRLLGSTQVGGSRLPPISASTDEERPPSPREEPATKRRKQVNFDAGIDVTPLKSKMVTPAESSMMTPAAAKRTATPYKLPVLEMADEDDSSMASSSPVVPRQVAASTPVGLLGPTGSFNPIPPATGNRNQPKLVLGTDNFAFCQPSEAKPLGSPCATRTPLFGSSALFNLGKTRDSAFNGEPKFISTTDTSGSSKTKKAIETAQPIQDTWACERCSSRTSVELNSCTKCGEKRPAPKLTGWGDTFKDQANKWKCQVCQLFNDPKCIQCPSCETPRAGKEKEVAEAAKASAAKGSIGASGFTFGVAPVAATGSIGSGGLSFGVGPTAALAPTGTGFSFGAAPAASAPVTSAGGFRFGTNTDASQPSVPPSGGGGLKFGATVAPVPAAKASPHQDAINLTKAPVFSFGVTPAPAPVAVAPSFNFGSSVTSRESGLEKKDEPKSNGFSFASAPLPAGTGGDKAPFKFTVGKTDEQPLVAFGSTSGSTPSTTLPATEPTAKRTRAGDSAPVPISGSKTLDGDGSNRPSFSFGGSSTTGTGFNFGSNAPPPSKDTFTSPAPALGSIPSKDSAADEDRSKRRRGGNEDTPSILPFGAPAPSAASSTPAFSFGSTPAPSLAAHTTFGSQPSNDAPAPAPSDFSFGSTSKAAPTPAPFLFGGSGDSSNDKGSSPAPAASSGFSFGSTPAPPSFGATPAALAPAFGSTPAAPAFGSAPAAPAPAFGSAPSAPAPAFGSAPSAPAPAFGSAPAPAFGSAPAAPAPAAPLFGAAPAPFGTPAPAPSVGFSFGSTPAPAPPVPGGFGSTPAPAAPAFGSTPVPSFGAAPAPLAFGGAPTGGGFGAAPAVPFTVAPASFGAPAPGGFGAGGGFGGAPPAPFGAPTPGGFGVAAPPAPPVGGFGGGGNFGAPAPDQGGFGGGFGAPAGGAVPQFSLGTGGGGSKGPAGRRIIKARRPRRA